MSEENAMTDEDLLEEVGELMDEYRRTFGQGFPRMMVMGIFGEDLIAVIKECLKKGRPFEPERDDVLY